MSGLLRRTTRGVVAVGTGLSLASLALVGANLRRVRRPSAYPPPLTEHIAVLLPVRDEAALVTACLHALLRCADEAPGRVRILVLDDESADSTGDLARAVAGADPRVRTLTGGPLPAGWLGKPWACQQLADAAAALPDPPTALVFVDADVRLRPGAVRATVALLRTAELDLVCPYPRQVAISASERLLQPLLTWSWMATLPLRIAERSPRPSTSVANGQLLAVDADAYERAGGHRGVRTHVLEDIALLRAVKGTGGRGVVADGSRIASCRMYDGWPDLRAGWTKSLWAAFGSGPSAAAVAGLLVVAYVVPAAAALRGSRLGLLGYVAGVLGRVLVARRTGGRVPTDALAHPVSVLLLVGLLGDSWRARRRGVLRWKGRPVETGGIVGTGQAR